MAERWIVIPNWDRFQHYKDRNPSWIKGYVELLNDTEFRRLTFPQRGLLFGIWLLYASTRREVPHSAAWLAHRLGGITEWEYRRMRESVRVARESRESDVRAVREAREHVVRADDLKALQRRGFIEVSASKPQQPAIPEKEREVLRTSLQRSGDARADAPGAAPPSKNGNAPADKLRRYDELLTAASRFAADWKGGTSLAFNAGLDELEQLTGARLRATDRSDLWDEAWSAQS